MSKASRDDLQVIAEIGSVHDGSFGNALRLIDTAAEVGASGVKLQAHISEAETLVGAPSPSYFSAESRFEYFARTAFTPEQWSQLRDRARSSALDFIVSPFSIEAVEMLETVGVDGYKVASGEVTNLPLLERLAETNQPVLLSSGMSQWAELDRAVKTLRTGGQLHLLQCSSIYPCPPERVGLNVMTEMRTRYGLPVGLSDHTMTATAAICAVYLGASVIEKHLTLSRRMYGSDAKHSMEPDEFQLMALALREAMAMKEHPVDKDDLAPYGDMKTIFEKSIVTARELSQGTTLEAADIAFKKPGDGIPAAKHREVLGKTLTKNLPRDHKLSEEDLR
jgi:N-acetylneuraminate synthase